MNKGKIIKPAAIVCICVILCCIILTACSTGSLSERDSSIVLVKNAGMHMYGTGFAVGKPGEPVDTLVTSYSVIATANGVPPKTAVVNINENENNLTASVDFYDTSRNIAILRLAEASEELEPIIFKDFSDNDETVYVRGYDGTGNIMSDFEKFNITDIVQYSGNISAYDELNSIVLYKYSNEFNRALSGAPAIDKNGYALGMCAYSVSDMGTYSQYILSSEEIMKCLLYNNDSFMTASEVRYKNIIIFTIVVGLILFAAIIAFALIYARRKSAGYANMYYLRPAKGIASKNEYKYSGKLSIGSDPGQCNVVIRDNPSVSALHCDIINVGNEIYLVDRFSAGGTYLADGTRINPSSPYKITEDRLVFYITDAANKMEFYKK